MQTPPIFYSYTINIVIPANIISNIILAFFGFEKYSPSFKLGL